MLRWRLVCCAFLGAASLGLLPSHSCSDPIADFLTEADSAAVIADGSALDAVVSSHALIVGAGVGQLLEAACQAPEGAQAGQAREKMALAQRLAGLYQNHTGSSAPLRLVETYRDWSADQRATRQRAKTLEAEATAARGEGDADRAIGLLGEALALYQSIDDARSEAILWGSLGIAHWAKADFAAVAIDYEKALAARRAIEDRILEGKTLNGLGSVNYELGNLDLAADYYLQAVDLRRRTGDLEGLATSLTYLGNAYTAMGRALDARTTLEQALPVVEQTGDKAKKYELLISTASLNAEMGRAASSNEQLRQALAIARELDDPKRQAVCHNNLALNFAEAYRYGESLRELEAVGTLLEEHPDVEQSTIYWRNKGITDLRIGEMESAQADFDTLYRVTETNQMPVLQLEALLNLGYLMKEMEKPEDGLGYAQQAEALAEELNNPKMLREALTLTAELERTLGNYEGAADTWRVLLAQDQAQNVTADVARDWMGIANNSALAGLEEEARQIYRKIGSDVEATDDGDLILSLAFGIGHSFEKTDPESSYYYYEKALVAMDEIRAQVGASGARTGYLGGARRSYFEEVATYYAGQALGDDAETWADRAFRTAERAKARGLLDMIEASTLGQASGAEEALVDSLYSLDRSAPDYERHRQRLNARYATAREGRLGSSVGQAALAPKIAGFADLHKALSGRAVLLAYCLGDTMSMMWAVSNDGGGVFVLPKRSDLNDEVARLRDAMARPVAADQALRESARRLYTILIQPAGRIVGKAEELIIVPDGSLFELPFEVLLAEEHPPGAGWNQLAYLARSHVITYAPSASTYLALRDRRKISEFDKDLLALGDPDYSMLAPLPGQRGSLVALAHTREEVMSISSPIPNERKSVYLGPEANEAVLKRDLQAGSFRIVHLAAHGLIDAVEPSASSIALCSDPDGIENGYFQTLEAMTLPMKSGLVVLSACESGRGQIGRGEGMVGLSRAFLASGARGVVASLWAVSDKSTAELMSEFYKRMLEKKEPAGRALNQARLAMISNPEYAHPYHWSSFVLIGLGTSLWSN